MASGAAIAGGVIVVIIVIVAIAYLATTMPATNASTTTITTSGAATTASTAKSATVPIGMTDPPSYPPGTQAVIITYSNVQVHTAGNATTGTGGTWVTTSGSGTVNTLAVVNSSQTVADATLAINSTVNAVRMNITSVKIMINGTTYAATAPPVITANVTGNSTIKSNSAVLVDFVTNVTTSTNSTSHATVYAFTTTSSKAVLTTNASVSVTIGAMLNLSSTLRSSLGLNI